MERTRFKSWQRKWLLQRICLAFCSVLSARCLKRGQCRASLRHLRNLSLISFDMNLCRWYGVVKYSINKTIVRKPIFSISRHNVVRGSDKTRQQIQKTCDIQHWMVQKDLLIGNWLVVNMMTKTVKYVLASFLLLSYLKIKLFTSPSLRQLGDLTKSRSSDKLSPGRELPNEKPGWEVLHFDVRFHVERFLIISDFVKVT
jgi:hypothetical protein